MKIAVCIKQVPNTEARLRVSRDGRWVDEEDLPFVINESDEYALEEGLRIACNKDFSLHSQNYNVHIALSFSWQNTACLFVSIMK